MLPLLGVRIIFFPPFCFRIISLSLGTSIFLESALQSCVFTIELLLQSTFVIFASISASTFSANSLCAISSVSRPSLTQDFSCIKSRISSLLSCIIFSNSLTLSASWSSHLNNLLKIAPILFVISPFHRCRFERIAVHLFRISLGLAFGKLSNLITSILYIIKLLF